MTLLTFVVPFLVITFTVPGCIGVVGIGDKETTHEFARPPGTTIKTYVSILGQPERIERDKAGSGREIWTFPAYRGSSLRWWGVVLLVILPIPLIVPVGHEDVKLVVEEGYVISKTARESEFLWGGVCGFIWHPHSPDDSGFKCGLGG